MIPCAEKFATSIGCVKWHNATKNKIALYRTAHSLEHDVHQPLNRGLVSMDVATRHPDQLFGISGTRIESVYRRAGHAFVFRSVHHYERSRRDATDPSLGR